MPTNEPCRALVEDEVTRLASQLLEEPEVLHAAVDALIRRGRVLKAHNDYLTGKLTELRRRLRLAIEAANNPAARQAACQAWIAAKRENRAEVAALGQSERDAWKATREEWAKERYAKSYQDAIQSIADNASRAAAEDYRRARGLPPSPPPSKLISRSPVAEYRGHTVFVCKFATTICGKPVTYLEAQIAKGIHQ